MTTPAPFVEIVRLRQSLLDAEYTMPAVELRLGLDAWQALSRNSTIPARRALAGARDPQAALITLWMLQQPVRAADLPRDFPVEAMTASHYLRLDQPSDGDGETLVVPLIAITPHQVDRGGHSGEGAEPDAPLDVWVAADLKPSLDSRPRRPRSDYVLGVAPASMTLAQMTIRERVGSALDLGTGCGVQSLHLSSHAAHVVATDVNPRAIEFARLSAELSQVDIDVKAGSLYEPVADESFDLIVSNPPYVMSPPGQQSSRLVYRESGFRADDLVKQVIEGCSAHLNPSGTLQVLANWAITADQDWRDRLASWVPDDCDALILERDRLSPGQYVEMWLQDAGVAGTAEWDSEYTRWLDYFDELGIVGVGMGWIEGTKHAGEPTLCASTSPDGCADRPDESLLNPGGQDRQTRSHDVVVEEWPWQVSQPVGGGFAAARTGRRLAHALDDELLGWHLKLTDGIEVEALCDPGAPEPRHIVYRQRVGLCRALEATTELGGVLGACDGELTLGQICVAVAEILSVELPDLHHQVLPGVRTALRYGMLDRA